MGERVMYDVIALGELLIGSILVVYSSLQGVVQWSAEKIALFFVSVLAGALIYTSIKLFFASAISRHTFNHIFSLSVKFFIC